MLKGKRAVVTGGGRDFGRAVSILLAREGAQVDLCARQLSAARQTCDAIVEAGGQARAFVCDMADPVSIRSFTEALEADPTPIDILVLSAAQWLEGNLGEGESDEDVAAVIAAGLTGSILLTKALLPSLRRSGAADIIAMVSVCGQPGFVQSGAHPAFYAAKHGMSGFCDIMRERLRSEDIRVTGLYPPDFTTTQDCEKGISPSRRHGDSLQAASIWSALRFALEQPRNCQIGAIHFHGHTRMGPEA